MSRATICEGCGRAPGASELYCSACGRALPGRQAPDGGSDSAPPGWLVAADARGESGFFEPLPAMEVSGPGWKQVVGATGWRTRESPVRRAPEPTREGSAAARSMALPEPAATPMEGGEIAPLRMLYAPLVALVVLSTAGAITLLILHVVLHR